MVRYRRNRVPEGTFFFTVTLRDRRSDALVRHVDALRDAWRAAKARIPHEVVAAVMLPDDLHTVIAMRDGSGDYPRLWSTRVLAKRICAAMWITCISIR